MKKTIRLVSYAILCYVTVLFLVELFFLMIQTPKQPAIKPTSQQQTQNAKSKTFSVHGSIPYWEQEEAFATFSQNVEQFDYVSVFWYLVQTDQSITPYRDAKEDAEIINFAHQHNVKVLAVITNLPDYENSEWDSDRIRPILENPEKRKQHIQDIVTLLYKQNFDGVNVDYEEVDADLRDEFSEFIEELSTELHNRDKLVGVAIHPKTGEDIPSEDNGSRSQDWSAIAAHADHLYIMAYGEHWNESNAGPVASIGWDTSLINYATQLQLPMEKVYMGVPLYGVQWQENTTEGEGLLYSDVRQLQTDFGVTPVYDELSQSPSLNYTSNNANYNVWFENARSVDAKIKLAKESGIGGITFWALGGEDPEVWEVLQKH